MEKIRIQKLLADAGYCSRRQAEKLISDGKVKVNGHPVKLGDKATLADLITVGGERVYLPRKKQYRYLMLYKPRGYVTTTSDELNRRCVMDLLEDVEERVYPVGRLDKDSEGLLLLTNDGSFANGIMHPSRHISKTYRVTVRPDVTEEQLIALSGSMELDGKMTQPATVVVKTKEPGRVVLLMTIHEGKNRQIRRMCEYCGCRVKKLVRVRVMNIELGNLPKGQYRDVTEAEMQELYRQLRAGNKKAGDYFSCQMRNILMIFSFSATEKPRNTLSTSSFNWRSFSSRGGRSLPASRIVSTDTLQSFE